MHNPSRGKYVCAILITFSGNCRRALTYYQSCFGGTLKFQTFEQELKEYAEVPVVSGSLVSDCIVIYGSDLVHDEGRQLGNYMSIFLKCRNISERQTLIRKLFLDKYNVSAKTDDDQHLVEVIDAFDVRWVLGI
ncbi:glyoxalase [Sphingobacterium sp. JB170]|uniref:glyoxalase n=1 Tax=Sphingobacterium sp. JB170 TaxID=1434842 RepID=UPI00097F65EF|nr:glyoxalase [Sphingobacterium sp. JB170]SJN48041.1 hypothetical protein FM107_16665 [Sphingobacterium sp. JB170]